MESQTSPPNRPPPPIPRDTPSFPIKVERRLTASGKRPLLLKSPTKSESREQKESPRLSPTFSLSPRTLNSFDENSTINYYQEFDDIAAELADALDFEINTAEKPPESKSESNSPKKKPKKSSTSPTSLEDLKSTGQSSSGARSPEKTSVRLQKLRQVSSLVKRLPTEHRLPRSKAVPSSTDVQKDSGSTSSGPEN
ncbi:MULTISPECIES: hypothetical protein [unclassified Variovorax]|uniref:hypothetical protein n=1 Tax=unclassified Variovorax TaxID=663243 RepID=UPI0011AF012A|nr:MULTISPECIES: hypothetical protein [unclassified Variovorax]